MNIEGQFGKGNQEYLFNSMVIWNDLQLRYELDVASPDSFPNSQYQSANMRVLNNYSSILPWEASFIAKERVN